MTYRCEYDLEVVVGIPAHLTFQLHFAVFRVAVHLKAIYIHVVRRELFGNMPTWVPTCELLSAGLGISPSICDGLPRHHDEWESSYAILPAAPSFAPNDC